MTPNGMHRSQAIKEFNTVVLGSPGVGKSSMIERFMTGQFHKGYTPTIEQKYKKMIVNGNEYSLVVLDTMGHEDRGTILDRYTLQQHGVLVVFDLSNEHSFQIAEELAEKLSGMLTEECPIILVGNKNDCQRVVDDSEAKRVVDEHGLSTYVECSAATCNENSVNEVFDLLISKIIDEVEEEDEAILHEPVIRNEHHPRPRNHNHQPPGQYNRTRANMSTANVDNNQSGANVDNNRSGGGGANERRRPTDNRQNLHGQNPQKNDNSECVVM